MVAAADVAALATPPQVKPPAAALGIQRSQFRWAAQTIDAGGIDDAASSLWCAWNKANFAPAGPLYMECRTCRKCSPSPLREPRPPLLPRTRPRQHHSPPHPAQYCVGPGVVIAPQEGAGAVGIEGRSSLPDDG
jgi:hypothetical protein